MCTNCKKRKKKCDRKEPCSSCISNNLDCEYTYSNHKPYTQSAYVPADLGQKNEKSGKSDHPATYPSRYESLVGINPYADHSIINFYSSSTLNSPLSWEALIGKDKFVNSLWSSLFTADVEPLQVEEKKQSIDSSSFHSRLTNIIPDPFTTSQLIDRFFSWVYTFIPFMDEATFRTRTSSILGQEQSTDYAWIGILLIILRFASLSQGTNCSHLVKTDAIDLACECLVRSHDSDDNFSVFVLSFFLKLYHKFSPEVSGIHEGEATQRANRSLIVRAKLLGLERGNFQDFGPGTKLMQQKIWQFLIMADMYQGYTYGYQLSIANGASHIKFDDQKNLLDQNFDQFVLDMFFLSLKFNDKLINLLNLILNPDGSATSAVCQSLSNFEIIILNEAGTFENCLQNRESDLRLSLIKRQFSIKNYLVFATFLVSIFWHLFLHFEDQNVNLSYYYLVKSTTLVNELLIYLPTALSCDECLFVICPSIEKFINRANQILLGLALRFSQYRHNSVRDDAYIKRLASIEKNFVKCIQFSFTILDKLPSYYVNGKRIKSVHSILLNKLDSFEFASTSKKLPSPFDVVQLEDIFMRSQIPDFVGLDFQTLQFADEVMMLNFDVKDRILDFDKYFHA